MRVKVPTIKLLLNLTCTPFKKTTRVKVAPRLRSINFYHCIFDMRSFAIHKENMMRYLQLSYFVGKFLTFQFRCRKKF